jgi:hypothetical protein
MTTAAETAFTREVLALAASMGVMAHWCGDSRKCQGPKGFPDLFIAGPRGILIAELKMPDGETSAEQDLWAWMLTREHECAECREYDTSAPYRLWRPDDLASGTIEAEFRRIA